MMLRVFWLPLLLTLAMVTGWVQAFVTVPSPRVSTTSESKSSPWKKSSWLVAAEKASRSTTTTKYAPTTDLTTTTTTTTTTTRADLLKGGAAFLVSSFLLNPTTPGVWARGLPSGPSKAELLEKTRVKDTEDPAEKKARLAQLRKERLERQKQLDAEEEARKKNPNRKEVELDANLRASYYYPTAQKRYLPRVKAAADELPAAKDALSKGQWDKVEAFMAREAENAALPLKLYASSLTGQGLSLDVSYVKVLNEQGDVYGKELEAFKKAVKAKDGNKALAALNKMEAALVLYRKTARIDSADGGVGEFPTDTKLGASFSNNNPALLTPTIK